MFLVDFEKCSFRNVPVTKTIIESVCVIQTFSEPERSQTRNFHKTVNCVLYRYESQQGKLSTVQNVPLKQ